MKFRGGIVGLKFSSQASAVEETGHSTGTDAETGLKTSTVTDVVEPEAGRSLDEKAGGIAGSGSQSSEDGPAKELQYGVQLAEATLKVWTMEHLILAYIL